MCISSFVCLMKKCPFHHFMLILRLATFRPIALVFVDFVRKYNYTRIAMNCPMRLILKFKTVFGRI